MAWPPCWENKVADAWDEWIKGHSTASKASVRKEAWDRWEVVISIKSMGSFSSRFGTSMLRAFRAAVGGGVAPCGEGDVDTRSSSDDSMG
eukprot:142272-Pleurochrysis_carterae.AAC.1